MRKSKVAITLDPTVLGRIDHLVLRRAYPSRSRAIEDVVREKLDRLDHSRLAAECAKLEPDFEKALAEEGLSEELRKWPEY